MKLLFDTNVILDVFLERTPFYEHSVACFSLSEKEKIEGWICGTTVTTLSYLLGKELGKKATVKHISTLLNLFNVTVINRQVLTDALANGFLDYEDAVLYQSALLSNLDGILTRNKRDFKASKISIYTPREFVEAISQ